MDEHYSCWEDEIDDKAHLYSISSRVVTSLSLCYIGCIVIQIQEVDQVPRSRLSHKYSFDRGTKDTNITSDSAVFKSSAMQFSAFIVQQELYIVKDGDARA